MPQSRSENHVDYLELPATDISATKQFYSSLFGWEFTDYGPDYTSFFDGRNHGGFTTDAPVTSRGVLLVIYARDLTAAQARIQGAGGTIVKETFPFPGGSRFHFTDPNGNELAVWSDA